MFARDNEEKRSQIWRVTVVVATLLILFIGGYMLCKMFTENPLLGTWISQERDLTVEIYDDGTISFYGEEEMRDSQVKYMIDKDNKRITFSVEMGNREVEGVESDSLETTVTFMSNYGYSVDQEYLTLTDIEFGEVEHFIKEQ